MRIKIVEVDQDGQPAELSSILKVIADGISWLQQSDDIEKLIIDKFLDTQSERLLDIKTWEPDRDEE